MITLPTRDESGSLRLSYVYPILPRHLQCAVHLLRSAATVKDARQPGRRVADQIVCQQFRRLIIEKKRVREFELRNLVLYRANHRGFAMPQAGNTRAAAGVQITPTFAVNDVWAIPFYGDGKFNIGVSWKY